jgi:parallel beta-helix repeat protein
LLLGSGACGTYTNNTIKDTVFGVYIMGSGKAVVSQNMIHGCSVAVQMAAAASSVYVSANHITGCGYGLSASEGSAGTFSANYVHGCEVNVLVDFGSSVTVTNNGLTKALKTACVLRGSGGALVAHNRLFDNTGGTLGLAVYAVGFGPAAAASPTVSTDAPKPSKDDSPVGGEAIKSPEAGILSPNVSFVALPPIALEGAQTVNTNTVPVPVTWNCNLPRHVLAIPQTFLEFDTASNTASLAPPAHMFTENDVYQNTTNVHIYSGNAVLKRNNVHRGDIGFLVNADAACSIESNNIFDNTRIGFRLNSKDCVVTGNEFSSKDQTAAEWNEEQVALHKGNKVQNQCLGIPHQLSTVAPIAPTDLSAQVPHKGRGDPTPSVFAALATIHREELPDFVPCGCLCIPGSQERSATATSNLFLFELDFASSPRGHLAPAPLDPSLADSDPLAPSDGGLRSPGSNLAGSASSLAASPPAGSGKPGGRRYSTKQQATPPSVTARRASVAGNDSTPQKSPKPPTAKQPTKPPTKPTAKPATTGAKPSPRGNK